MLYIDSRALEDGRRTYRERRVMANARIVAPE